jgi:hypothetical protein
LSTVFARSRLIVSTKRSGRDLVLVVRVLVAAEE